MCAIRPLHIYHLAAAVTYVWCFWCILVHSDFLFSAFGFFFFTWYCISLVFYIILLWFNSSVLKIFLLNFSRSTCNNNVTQPQSFLIGILFSVICDMKRRYSNENVIFTFIPFPSNSCGFISSSSKCKEISNLLFSARF